MDMEKFLPKLKNALSNLVENEDSIIDRKLNEVCINHRFANHLKSELNDVNTSCLNVDLEYDKNYDKKKEILTELGKKAIRPDILIHQRENNYKNMVAIECKKNYMNKNDKEKLKKLLKEPYNYNLTCWVSYLPDKTYMLVKIYQINKVYIYHFDKDLKKIFKKREKDII